LRDLRLVFAGIAILVLLFAAEALATDITACTTFNASTFYNLTADISNSGATCMVMANNTILDCQGYTIDGTGASNTYGVYANNSVNVTVFNCTIVQFNQGLLFNYTDASNVSWVNSSFNSQNGLRLMNSSGNLLSNNSANNNSLHGVFIDLSSKNNTIAFNFVNNNTQQGVILNDSSNDNNVSFNTVNYNTQHGFYNYQPSNNNSYVGNTAYGNTIYGFRFFNSQNCTLVNNSATNSPAGGGFRIYQNNNLTAINNTAAHNGKMGFEILVSSQNGSFANNTIYNNSASGINIESSAHHNVFTGNNISLNGYAGYNTSSSSVLNITLLNNTFASNGWNSAIGSGLRIFFNMHILRNNTMFNNSYHGIHLNANNSWLDGNNFTGNKEAGIWMRNSRSGNFTNNIIDGNGDASGSYNDGFYIDNSALNNNFTNNTITNSYTYDIEVGSTSASTGNTFLNTSFNWSKVVFPTGSNQTVQWFSNVNVTNSLWQAIVGAYVNITNATSSTPRLQLATGADGTTGWNLMTQWWGNVDSNVSFTPHNVSVNHSSSDYAANYSSFQVNATGSLLVVLADVAAPSVSLNAPADGLVTNVAPLSFNGTPSDNMYVRNISLFSNFTGAWIANATNSSPYNNTLSNFAVSGIADGVWRWALQACDYDGNCAFSVNRTFTRVGSDLRSSGISTNVSNPVMSSALLHSVFWQSFSPSNLSGYIFSSNYSGAWVNQSFVQFAELNLSWSNVSATAPGNDTWGWQVYANDSGGLWNGTGIQNLSVSWTGIPGTGGVGGGAGVQPSPTALQPSTTPPAVTAASQADVEALFWGILIALAAVYLMITSDEERRERGRGQNDL
jgi:parallel beta-helix repeat protein